MNSSTGNIRYDENIRKLSSLLHDNEIERRKWAEEKWIHEDGRLIKISKPLSYILSAYTFLSSILFCLILNHRTLMYTTETANPELSSIPFFISMTIVMCILFIIGNFFMIQKKYFLSMLFTGIAGLFIGLIFASQLGAKLSSNNYLIFYSINISLCIILIVSVISVYSVMHHEKADRERMLENTLNKLARGKGQAALLSLDEYSELIEEYFKKEEIKAKKRS